MNWEYASVVIAHNKKRGGWTAVEGASGEAPMGLQPILDWCGSRGWELVSLQTETGIAYPQFAKWSIEPESYRATFKRPAE